MVTVDGSLVHVDSRENADLFWALRGGGVLAQREMEKRRSPLV